MRTLIVFGLASILIFTSCQETKEQHEISTVATISGQIENYDNTKIKLRDFFGKGPWQQDIPVNNNSFALELNTDEPVMRTLSYGNTRKDVFLQPGKSLEVTFDATNVDSTFTFSGDLGEENTMLDVINSRLSNIDYRYVYDQPLDVAKMYMDSLKQDSQEHFAKLSQAHSTSTEFQDYMNSYITYKTASTTMMLGDRKDEQPEGYYDFMEELTLEDPKLLNLRDYRMFLYTYIEHETNKRLTAFDSVQQQAPDAEYNESLKVIAELKNDDIRAYSLYNIMIMRLKDVGVDEFDKDYNYFKEHNTSEFYTKQMQIAYEEKQRIAPGKPAPDFALADVDGNQVSLKDFKGQYVYMDFWQTLCPRSGRELPHYLKLQSEYQDENIAFVSISVDQNEENWRNYVKEKKNVGTSLRAEESWDSDVYTKYQVNGLPSFIIIDPEGNIVDPVAAKPSTDNIRTTFNELLKTE